MLQFPYNTAGYKVKNLVMEKMIYLQRSVSLQKTIWDNELGKDITKQMACQK